jgi:hypothetical protein
LGVCLASAPTAHAHVVLRGVSDPVYQYPDAERAAAWLDIGRLHAKVVRFDLLWCLAEPQRGELDDAYLQAFSTAVDEARAVGVSVIVTLWGVPQWASDKTLWDSPPGTGTAPGYQPYYAIDPASYGDFGEFGQMLSSLLAGRVLAYECWNEPNLGTFIYPQRLGSDDDFAVHRYLGMLQAFHAGVEAGDPQAKVIAGSTAPLGFNDAYRTSPQRFAQRLKAVGAAPYFDVYAHHPFVPGGVIDTRPEAAPVDPKHMVTLGNLRALLPIFPSKPFYITEYAYNTAYTQAFNGAVVSQITQAQYLRRAYQYVQRFPQVKMLLWYPRRDQTTTGSARDPRGVYSGLRDVDNRAKRAWYVFAGGNRLTIVASGRLRRGSSLTVKGRLTCAAVAGVTGKPLVVQFRRIGGSWKTLKVARSQAGGYYSARFAPAKSGRCRVVWRGVVASAARSVTVY